jgi:hypothetical protein
MLKRHVSYANVAATLALVFAMSGGALAARHYLVNSTKQISPKVLKKLKGRAGPQGATGPQGKEGPQGGPGSSVVARIRGAGSAETTTASLQPYALKNAVWSQGPTEVEWIEATVTFTAPPQSKCNFKNESSEPMYGELLIDGFFAGSFRYEDEVAEQKNVTRTVYAEPGLVDNGATQAHTMTAKIEDFCGEKGGSAERHFIVESINVDVIGTH